MMLSEPRPEVSVVMENYLQAMYKLVERGVRVFPARLAEAMNVSAATVVGMLKRLTRQGMVTVAANKEVVLTAKGNEVAESVVRRHRLAERMLIEILGLEWYKAHHEAHRLEHAISPDVEAKLAKALSYPRTNPYGLPIPGYNDTLSPMKPLGQAQEGDVVTVRRVPEEDMRLLMFFDENNLKPGEELKVKELAPFKGTVTVLMNESEVVLGMEVAEKIMVSPGT